MSFFLSGIKMNFKKIDKAVTFMISKYNLMMHLMNLKVTFYDSFRKIIRWNHQVKKNNELTTLS